MENKAEKWKLHGKPCINSSGFHMQPISTNFSENMLACNVYGSTKLEVKQRSKLTVLAPEMLEMLKQTQTLIDKLSYANLITPEFMNECYNILSENQKLINKATE